jgi:peptide/nickel transport system substrate-binding protein
VKMTLTKPRTSFVPALAGSQAAILPMQELKAGTYNPKKDLLGTGPFKVAAHSQNESWTFVRNPYYWQPGVPKAAKLLVRIMPEDSARVAALRAGSIDVSTFENPDSTQLLKGQAAIKTVVQSTTDFYRLDINARTSLFRDARLRQALALSIDREKMRTVALGGVGRATAAVSVSFPGVCDPATLPFATPDVQKAKQLVEQAGATGKSVEIVSLPIVPMSSPMAQVLQQNLQAAGLKARITPLEIGQALKRLYRGTAQFDMAISWSAGYADPAMVLPWWNPQYAPFAKGYTKPDPDLNKLIESSLSAPPGPQRLQTLRDACGRISQDANTLPLLSKDAIIAYRSDKVSAVIPQVEGYAVPLRQLAQFGVK